MSDKNKKPQKAFQNLKLFIVCIVLLCASVFCATLYTGTADEINENDTSISALDEAAEAKEAEEAEVKTTEAGAEETEEADAQDGQNIPEAEGDTTEQGSDETTQMSRNGISTLGTTAVVTDWAEFVAALADTGVSTIDIQTDLTRSNTGTAYNPGTIDRDLIIAGNNHTIDFGSGGTSNNGILLSAPSAASATLILSDVYLIKTTTAGTPVFYNAAASSNWNIMLNNVRTGSGNTAGLIGAQNADVTVYGTDNNLTYSNSSNLFNVGNLTMDNGASLTVTASIATASTSVYTFAVGGEFTMGAGSKLEATSVRMQLFSVGGNFIMQAGATTLTASTTYTGQTNRQFNISGNFVMEDGANLTTTTATTTTSDTYYQVGVGGMFSMGNNTTLVAESAGKSLFGITGDFTVGEYASVTTNSTSGANRQISAANFTVGANSTITTTSVGATYQFYVGNFEVKSDALVKAQSSGASNAVVYITGGEVNLRARASMYIENTGSGTSEGANSPTNSHGIYGSVTVMNLEAESLLDIYASSVGYRTMVTNSLTMVDGAVFNVVGVNQSAIALTENYSDTNSKPATINIDGAGTQLNIECSSTATVNYGAAMVVAGESTNEGSCVFNVTNGAEINGHATSNTVLQVRSNGSVFTIKDGGKMSLVQDGGSYNLGATLRFRIRGNQTFNIDNGEVSIQKKGGIAAGVRLYGSDNAINVTNGGKFEVQNNGSGTIYNGSGDGQNQGIHYDSGSTGNNFRVDGYKSEIDIQADCGPAIYSEGSTVIEATNSAIFKLSGITSSYNYGTIGCGGLINITLDNPLYFDIRNNRVGSGSTLGGYCLSSGSSSSTFTTTNSDLSVWTRGSNLDGDPTKTWSLFDYALTGTYFQTIASTSIPTEFNSSTYGSIGAQAYSRMSANNAAAVVDELRVPTNADKYIYGHAYVPEGNDGNRDAWTDEVYVTVEVKNSDGTTAYTKTGTTVGAATDGSDNGRSVYGEPERAGIIVIDTDGVYLETGQTVEVVSAWRGDENSSGRVHTSTAEDLQAAKVTTRDVTPPTALTVSDVDTTSSRMYNGDLTTRTDAISGTGGTPGAAIYLYKKADSTAASTWAVWASGTVAADGSWSIILPGILADGNIVAIALNDKVPNATDLTSYDIDKLTDNGIFTNNGNENPSGDYAFHDAIFSTRVELDVIYYGVLELTVSTEINYGSSNPITQGEATYPAGTMELKVEDSRVIRNEWELTAEMQSPFTLDGGSDVLNVDLVYSYNGTDNVIGSSAVSIWRTTNTSDIFNIYDQWTLGGSGNGLYVKASAGNVKVGSYTAKVKWILSDVP